MKTTPAKVTMDQKELEMAVKDYVQSRHTSPVKCIGTPQFSKVDYGYIASCDIEASVVETKIPNHPTSHYQLRHRETKLFLRSLVYDESEKRWVLGVNQHGYWWANLDSIFSYIEQEIKTVKSRFKNLGLELDTISLQEKLLEYEIVHIGEIKAEDMTFHLDKLKKI